MVGGRRKITLHSQGQPPLQWVGMGVQPAFRVKKRKLSLAPLEPAPRAPVATFDEPGAAQSGCASGTIASGGVGGFSSGLGGDVVASAEQRGGSLDFEGWASETTGSSAADAISATLGGYVRRCAC